MRLSQRKQIEIAAIIGTFCIGLFLFDYFHTRSSANLAITLARLGPETPLETYKAEFGEPTYHLTNIEEMKERGPAKMTPFYERLSCIISTTLACRTGL